MLEKSKSQMKSQFRLKVQEAEISRPGIPMETEPRALPGVHWASPERQVARVTVFKRVGLKELTPVFGTSQPPRGVSGLLRAAAYRIPETKAFHWAALLFADRVDVLESTLAESFQRRPFLGFWALLGTIGWVSMRKLSSSR